MSRTEKKYWIGVTLVATLLWAWASWNFYVCDVKGFCGENKFVITTENGQTQTASIFNAFDSSQASRVGTIVEDTNRYEPYNLTISRNSDVLDPSTKGENIFVPVADRPAR